MDLNSLKEWLIPASTFVTLITLSIGSWRSLNEYRLKLKAETRLRDSARVESDVQLLKLFTQMMDIAHARITYHVSEKAVEQILRPENLQPLISQGKTIHDVLNESVIILPVGSAAQDAAIAAIAELGTRHEILRIVSLQALESLLTVKPDIVTKYLELLKHQRNLAIGCT